MAAIGAKLAFEDGSFQLSAVSTQLLKQHGQHALQSGRTLRQFRVIVRPNELQILGPQQLIAEG